MVRNIVKKIRSKLQESNNAYEDVVTPQKRVKGVDSLRTPTLSPSSRRRSRRTPASPPRSLRLNSKEYVALMRNVVAPWYKSGSWKALRLSAGLSTLPTVLHHPEVAGGEPGGLHQPQHLAA